MSKLDDLLNSFENDGDGWMYYGDVDPADARAELAELRNKNCGHDTGIVLVTLGNLSITRCTWGCGEIHFEWLCRDGITRTFLTWKGQTK